MKTGNCTCGNTIFFGNFLCLRCRKAVGRCNHCHALSSFTGFDDTDDRPSVESSDSQPLLKYRCDQVQCGAEVNFCENRERAACNAMVDSPVSSLCQWCQYTTLLPDLNQPNNLARWSELERAKRQLLLQLEDLSLPPYAGEVAEEYPLVFQFLEHDLDANGSVTPVYTGHADGVITVNIIEADSVQREQARVSLGEPQRTLIGHMRHEIGHYLDWCFARRIFRDEYEHEFGDPEQDYTAAQKKYYDNGPQASWRESFVSGYATMHPCEDFAETVNLYLDLLAVSETANEQFNSGIDRSPDANIEKLVQETLPIAIAASEFSRDMGLPLLLPEQLPPPVIRKLALVHRLRAPESLQQLVGLKQSNGLAVDRARAESTE